VRQAQKPIPRRFLAILPAVLIFGSLHQGKEQKSQQPLTQIASSKKTD
jgi:hypothetical protein